MVDIKQVIVKLIHPYKYKLLKAATSVASNNDETIVRLDTIRL